MPDFFLHPQGICESVHVGPGTRIWAFAHVLAGARLGRDCNICDHVFIENDVVVGDRVTIKCGVQLWDGLRLADDVFVGPNASFTNDPFPRSKQHPAPPRVTTVGPGASIGANATILPGLEIGAGAMVGAGAVVTHAVPPHAIVAGNPARITGYTDSPVFSPPAGPRPDRPARIESRVPGVALINFPVFEDMRGALAVGEFPGSLPFAPKRFFSVYNVPGSEVRGAHAHLECHQVFVCVKGRVNITVDNGTCREEFQLGGPEQGLYVPPLVWATQYRHAPETTLLVLASHPYAADDYVRDYATYLQRIPGRKG